MEPIGIILASASPRRRQLLELLNLPFEVVPSSSEDLPRAEEQPAEYALRAAREKALDVARRHSDRPVLGADTVVEIEGGILGKPSSTGDAREMLKALSGRRHLVHSALALVARSECSTLIDTTEVDFLPLSDAVIRWYVRSGEPMDKAGAYAIQGLGGLLVREVRGSPHTVVGLPIHRLPELFGTRGMDFWEIVASDSD
jgi:septum formation protein